MNTQYENGFCPQCGALLRDGVCPCCHYQAAQPDNNGQNYGQSAYTGTDIRQDYGQGYYTGDNPRVYAQDHYGSQTAGSNGSKSYTTVAVVVGVIMFVVALLSALVFGYWGYDSRDDLQSSDPDYSPDYSNGYDDDDYDGDYDDDYDYDDSFGNDIDWDDTTWAEEPDNMTADEVWDKNHQYYEELNNCIDENVSYQLIFKTEEELDKDNDICMRGTYYQLEGDIPNLDEINETLKDQALADIDYFNYMKDDYEEAFEDYGAGYTVDAKTYVTYNDESVVSMVTSSRFDSNFEAGLNLYCVNIDLQTGMVLINEDILDMDEAFVKDIIRSSNKQNGTISYLEETDMDELVDDFNNSGHMIIFYTPCGLEVGMNYYMSSEYGWFTISLTDYEKYLKSY